MTKRITFIASLVILGIYIVVGILAPLIATKYPYTLKVEDKTYYPAFENFLSFYKLKKDNVLHHPEVLKALENSQQGGIIAFDPEYIDLSNTQSQPPGSLSTEIDRAHLLGTDDSGRDLMSNLIHGAFNSLTISFSSVTMALIIALLLAVPCSFLGDDSIRFTRIKFTAFILLMALLYILTFIVRPLYSIFNIGILCRCIIFIAYGVLLVKILSSSQIQHNQKLISLPLDAMMMRVIEFMKSVPKLLILLVVLAASPAITPGSLCIIIALLIWPSFYRYIRASIYEQKNSPLFESLKNLGYTNVRILLYHFIPKTIRTIMIPFVFSLIAVILFEATLSFLGIGLEASHISWGKILAEARNNMSAWWMAVFPGLAIFILVISLNRIGDYLLEKWT